MQEANPDVRRDARNISASLDRLIAAIRGTGGNVGGLLLLLVALVTLFSALLPATFPRLTTLQAMMFQLPELGLLSLAMAIPLISGGINLAIVATANQAGLLMAWILISLMPPDAEGAALALWLTGALAAGLALCIVIGLITGILFRPTHVHPLSRR